MDTLISKWKQTVDNHNKKLKNLREESLTRSLSHERTAAITASSLLLQTKALGTAAAAASKDVTKAATSNEMTFSLQNQRVKRRRPRIDASSSSSDSADLKRQMPPQQPVVGAQSDSSEPLETTQTTQQAVAQARLHHERDPEERKKPRMVPEPKNDELLESQVGADHSLMESMLAASNLIDCEDPATIQIVRGILDLFPAKRHLGQPLADLLMHHNARSIDERKKLESELQAVKNDQNHSKKQSSIQDQRKAELDRQVETISTQVRQLQEQVSDLEQLDQLQIKKYTQVKSQQNLLNLLSDSQTDLQKANSGLQAALLSNEQKFSEQEQVWEGELQNLRNLIAHTSQHR